MAFDWKGLVGSVAPGIATALGGPLAGGIVSILADKVLGGSTGDPVQDEAKLAGMLSAQGLTPEIRAKIIEAENAIKLEMIKAGLREKEIEADTTKAYLEDVQSARAAHANEVHLVRLASAVLITWAMVTAVTLIGLYLLLTKGIEVKDAGIVATVFTVMGTLTGYVSNSAQQVLGYYFGSSRGSAQKTDAITQAITTAVKK